MGVWLLTAAARTVKLPLLRLMFDTSAGRNSAPLGLQLGRLACHDVVGVMARCIVSGLQRKNNSKRTMCKSQYFIHLRLDQTTAGAAGAVPPASWRLQAFGSRLPCGNLFS